MNRNAARSFLRPLLELREDGWDKIFDFSQPLWGHPDLAERIVSTIPKGRIAEPEEIVGAVLFLASDAASFITGQTIYVDGGFLAG